MLVASDVAVSDDEFVAVSEFELELELDDVDPPFCS